MSAGRNLCTTAIAAAEELRRYATSLGDFDDPAAKLVAGDAFELARRLEALVPPILDFEGERRPELPPGGHGR